MNKNLISIASLILIFAFTTAAQVLSTGGEVVDVIDGKTVIVAIPNGRVKVELQFIEVPEPGQQLHGIVKDHLRKLLIGKVVDYKPRNLYSDRTVGRVMLKGVDISQQMLRDGAAWHSPITMTGQDSAEFSIYASLESAAKNERRGVWSITGLSPTRTAKPVVVATPAKPVVQIADAKAPTRRKFGKWSDKNPLLGDVGALTNGYNAETGYGYVGTSLLGVEEATAEKAKEQRTAVDITYYYKEDPKKGRSGIFVINVVSVSKEWRFLRSNAIAVIAEGKTTVIGKPKRETKSDGERVQEMLTYEVKRSTIESIVNGGDVQIKIGDELFQPRYGLQLILNNMLEISK